MESKQGWGFHPLQKLSWLVINLPLRTKILAIVFFGMAVLSVVSVTGLDRLRDQYDQLLYESYEMLLGTVADRFTQSLDDTADYMTTIATDATLQAALADIKDAEDRTALGLMRGSRGVLQGFLNSSSNTGLYALGVYTDQGAFYNSTYYSDNGYDPELGTKFSNEEISAIAREVQEGKQLWTTRYSGTYGLVVAQHVRRISPMRLDSLGVLVGCMDLEQVVLGCTQRLQQESCYFALSDGESGVFYVYDTTSCGADFYDQYPDGAPYAVLNHKNGSHFAIRGSIDAYGWDYLYAIPYDSISDTLRSQYTGVLVMLLFCIVVAFGASALLLRQILQDFSKLMDMINKVRRADFDSVTIGTQDRRRRDEVGVLIQQFTRMSNEIDQLIQDNYESRLLAQEAKLQALEMQINPHFLYNTLESVRCCARLGQNDDVCRIVESLGSILHFIMSGHNNEIHLRQELGLIDDYLAIQQLRFDDKLDFAPEIGPDCCDAVLPKLTLLPLVENAVIHGVENSVDVCRIRFIVRREGDSVRIQVKNTGTQFTPDLLEKLRSNEIRPTRHGIGLLNVDSRLELYFKDEYRIDFYNEGDYAVADVTIPHWTTRRNGGENIAETGHCG